MVSVERVPSLSQQPSMTVLCPVNATTRDRLTEGVRNLEGSVRAKTTSSEEHVLAARSGTMDSPTANVRMKRFECKLDLEKSHSFPT